MSSTEPSFFKRCFVHPASGTCGQWGQVPSEVGMGLWRAWPLVRWSLQRYRSSGRNRDKHVLFSRLGQGLSKPYVTTSTLGGSTSFRAILQIRKQRLRETLA